MSNVSKEDIIAAIKECAGKMGRAPKYAELLNHFPPAKMGAIGKYLGTYTLALRESGLDCLGAGFEVAMDELFHDWALIVGKMKKLPTMTNTSTRASTACVRWWDGSRGGRRCREVCMNMRGRRNWMSSMAT
jgi:hypothetical protein